MKLKDYIKNIQKLEPEYGELDVIYSSDDEGNRYRRVWTVGKIGYFNADNDFIDDGQSQWYKDTYQGELPINAVCIN